MAEESKKEPENGAPLVKKPRCLSVASAGIRTGRDFADFMSSLMSDLIEGNVSPQIGNAAVNAGGKLLKIVELQYKYGHSSEANGREPKDIRLTTLQPEEPAAA